MYLGLTCVPANSPQLNILSKDSEPKPQTSTGALKSQGHATFEALCLLF